MAEPLLCVRDLAVAFETDRGTHRALESVSFDVEAGAALGLAGGNGAGKTLVALALLQLLPPDAVLTGSIRFAGQELVGDPAAVVAIRGSGIALVFQDARAAFDPFRRIGKQIVDAVGQSRGLGRRDARGRAQLALDRVGISDATSRGDAYPDELSRGVLQEALVAMAIAVEPTLLVADDPVSALDGIERERIAELLVRSTEERGAALLLASADARLLASATASITVLEAGRSVESGVTSDVLARPTAPATTRWLHGLTSPAPATASPIPRVEAS